ncbi:hypothetical protein PGB90_007065 [Kerria lacca]
MKRWLSSLIAADFVLLTTSNILGLFAFYQVDKQQRTAFLETRQSLKMKLSIEEQSAEQVKIRHEFCLKLITS